MNNKSGAFDLRDIENRPRRDSAIAREQAEANATGIIDGRKRLRKNRTEQVAMRTSIEYKALHQRLADALGISMVEVYEQALTTLKEKKQLDEFE